MSNVPFLCAGVVCWAGRNGTVNSKEMTDGLDPIGPAWLEVGP